MFTSAHLAFRAVASLSVVVTLACGFGMAPAGADPGAFHALSCRCQETAPAGSEARTDEIAQGIQDGLLQG